ncbi:restriction endonuclease subunit S [Anaerostipes hadrus]|uniref:restriction endonuclease subunit S n=1 Tax=Anaerostipes hadrus TaxID=649756 RepID=UPI001D0723E3|nr:restriction endonuclease subunit S [Anaerostipes hadrus]MCB6744986.1 restriction endonuclease subunit S [Anaerostipes hadrus]
MSKPKIRFKGYEEDWEQRKFGNVTELKSASRVHKEEWTTSGVPFYRSSDVMAAINGTENEKVYISEALYEKLSSISGKLEAGDVLVTGGGSVGKPYIVPNNEPLYTKDADLLWIKNQGKFHPYFLYEFFFTPTFRSYLSSISHVGTIAHYTITQLSETPICLPSVGEQQKIGDYFYNIDHLITLHQRKCEETKKLKKYMLQKMFPQNGKRVPEIRFVGFTEDWEQRKLGDIAEFSKGSGYSKGDLIESGTPIILYGRLYTKYETSISEVDTYVEAKDGSVYSKGGEVIVPASGETAEDIARAATVDKSGVILGGDLNVVSPNEDINSAFLAISISHGNSQRELAKKAQGKSIVHIHNEEIKNLVVPFPTKAEQNKIVEYFSSLDNLITLHQRKYEELQKIKKFMLQNMFI